MPLGISIEPENSISRAALEEVDSLVVFVFSDAGAELVRRGIAIDSSTASFRTTVSVPYARSYRVAVLAMGQRDRGRPGGPTLYGGQLFDQQALDAGLGTAAVVPIRLAEAVPNPAADFVPGTGEAVLHWPRIARAISYTLEDPFLQLSITLPDTFVVDVPTSSSLRVRANFEGGIVGAFSESTFNSSGSTAPW